MKILVKFPFSSVHVLRQDRFPHTSQRHGGRLHLQKQVPIRHYLVQHILGVLARSELGLEQLTAGQDLRVAVRRSRVRALPFDLAAADARRHSAARLQDIPR